MPDADHLTVHGGENQALMAAADVVKERPVNAGFAATIDFDPT
jgi:hypothetical protein